MEFDENYKKQHTATTLIETEGWTKDLPESVESRFIYSDKELDNQTVKKLRAIYPVIV